MSRNSKKRAANRSGREHLRRYFAELVGTFVLVFTGVGCAVLAGPQVGALGVAFAFGFALLAMIYSIGPISGCHVNPAVTLGLFLAGKMERRYFLGYWVAQLVASGRCRWRWGRPGNRAGCARRLRGDSWRPWRKWVRPALATWFRRGGGVPH